MRRMIRSVVGTAALGVALALGVGAVGTAAVAEAGPITIFQSPVVTGPDIGPSAATPAGMFPLISPIAVTGETPGVTTFSVPDLKPYYFLYNYRFITIRWQNLQTGASGAVDLRYWQGDADTAGLTYPSTLPTSAAAETGSGPIVATVEHRTTYGSPPPSNALIPGLWAFWA